MTAWELRDTVTSLLAGRRILRALKDQTSELHQEAEHYVRILDTSATLDDYRRYLATMAGFHGPIEAVFAVHTGLDELGFASERRRKMPLLVTDLAALGVTRWEFCTALPSMVGQLRAIGVAYVLEGSTLGGRFILSRLPPAIAAVRGHATSFLEGYGDATGQHWRAFGAVVQRGVRTESDEREAIEGARDAFRCMIEWLARHEARAAAPRRGLG